MFGGTAVEESITPNRDKVMNAINSTGDSGTPKLKLNIDKTTGQPTKPKIKLKPKS